MNPAGDARQLFGELLDHTGDDAHGAVVEPWLARHGGGYRDRLTTASGLLVRSAAGEADGPRRDAVWELYALSRVSDVLLLSFQPPGYDRWVHAAALAADKGWESDLFPFDWHAGA